MPLRVTFDSNVLDYACRPERYPKDVRQPRLQKVRDALSAGIIAGFYSITMLTIEGIMCKDRAEVFESTTIRPEREQATTTKNADLPEAVRAFVGDADLQTIRLNLVAEQPARKPLHPEVIARVRAAHSLGLLALKAVPRVGAYTIHDPDKTRYLDNGQGDALGQWIDKADEVATAIESRGVGMAQVKKIGQGLASGDPAAAWFGALQSAKDIHEKRAIERAIAEWADGDSLASHIAYGIDVFCSADVGNSNVVDSVLDPVNRAWLTASYGVKFMTFDELLATLP
jgi:hypothetical protein